MQARYSYAVYDEDLVALDLIGADSAVKAIHATLRQGKPVWLDGWMRRKMAVDFRTERTVLENSPPLFRWHIVPVLSENDPTIPVYGWDNILPREQALVGALARWTVWPVLPEWAEILLRLGRENDLIRDMRGEGVDYAFWLSTQGWGEVIDQAVKDGLLPFPD
jgi:hypothetical protein